MVTLRYVFESQSSHLIALNTPNHTAQLITSKPGQNFIKNISLKREEKR